VRLETVPLIIGVIIALIGLGILADSWSADAIPGVRERRRSPRTERSLGGEACIGLGVLCIAAAILGRDTWDYVNVAVIAGVVLVLLGTWTNRRYLRDRISNRGALRRAETPAEMRKNERPDPDAPPPPNARIR
jgi:energy-converting hydrogenase Eha subunit A